MVILDTDIIRGVFKNNKDAIEKIKKLEQFGVEMETTSINTFELFEGAFRSKNENSLNFVREFISNLSHSI